MDDHYLGTWAALAILAGLMAWIFAGYLAAGLVAALLVWILAGILGALDS